MHPYIPPPYRPRIFPTAVRWILLFIGCFVFVIICVALMWGLAAVLDHPY